jgi:tail length tape measure protein
MTAPDTVSVASLALDSSGISQAISEFGQAMSRFQSAVDAAGQHAAKSSQSIDQIAESAQKAGAAAEEHLGRARAEAEKGNAVFTEFANGLKSYMVSFLTFEAVKHTLEGVIETLVDAENADARLTAVLKATGGVAGITAEQIAKMGDEISANSIYTDEAVKSAATRLLTFDNVRGPVFERALRDSADLASLTGRDLTSAALMLGRALESPSAGFMLLRQAGVVFTQAEKEQLRVMEGHNRILEAQMMILKKVESSSNGAAAAIRDTLGGAFSALSSSIKESVEQLRQSDGPLRRFVEGLALLAKPGGSPLEEAQNRINLVKFNIANAAQQFGMKPDDLEHRLRMNDQTLIFGGPMTQLEFEFMRKQLANIQPDQQLVASQPSFTLPGAVVTPGGARAVGTGGAPLPPAMILSQEQQNALRSLIDSEREELLTLKGSKEALEALKVERALHAGEIQHATIAEYAHITALLKEAQTHAAVRGVLQKMNQDSRAQLQYRAALTGDLTDPANVEHLRATYDQLAESTKKFYELRKRDAGSIDAAQQEIRQLEAQAQGLRYVNEEEAKFAAEVPRGTDAQRARTKALQEELIALQDGQKYWDSVIALQDAANQVEAERHKTLIQGLEEFQHSLDQTFGDALTGKANSFRAFTIELVDYWRDMLAHMAAASAAAAATNGLLSVVAPLLPDGFGYILAGSPPLSPTAPVKPIPVTPGVGVIGGSSSSLIPSGAVGGGGQTVIVQAPVHFTVQAIDSASFQDTLAQHAGAVQQIVVSGIQRSRRMASSLGVSR